MNNLLLVVLMVCGVSVHAETVCKYVGTSQVMAVNEAGYKLIKTNSHSDQLQKGRKCAHLAHNLTCTDIVLDQDELVPFGEHGSGGVYYTDLGRDRTVLKLLNDKEEIYFSPLACKNGILNAIVKELE